MPIRRFFLDQFPWLHFISISILLTLSGDYWTIWAFLCFCRERSLGNTDHCFTVYKNSITGKKKLIFHWTIFIFKTSWRETWNYTLLFIQSYLAAFMSMSNVMTQGTMAITLCWSPQATYVLVRTHDLTVSAAIQFSNFQWPTGYVFTPHLISYSDRSVLRAPASTTIR